MSKKQIEDRSLTVSEIAKKAHVSRNLVWSYIRKNKIEAIDKKSSKFKFDSRIVSEIKEKQEKKQEKKSRRDENVFVSENVLEILHEQLKIKDEQIEKQNETIEFLRSEVISARLEAKNNKKLLDDEKKKNEAISANEIKEETEKKKKSWWQKLFRGFKD